jgi:ribosomal protein S18 acetylase RimI-like enzyme
MCVFIRRAKASDAEFLAWVTLTASRAHLARGLWDLIIGADEAGCLDYLQRLAIAEPRSLYHWSSYIVAEIDGERAAALCGFEPQDGGWATAGDAMSNVQRELAWTDADAAASYQRIAPVWAACSLPDAGADYVIENVATKPEYRRRGYAVILLDVILHDAFDRDCTLAQITTYMGNDAALLVYEKAGFKVLDEKRCTDLEKLLGVPGFIRLTRELKIEELFPHGTSL